MVRVYAHRGASADCPENTLAAFARAMDLGADGIELDVHLSRDGVPVVIHDERVDRTTNGTGNVADLTVGELQALDAGKGEAIPTLAQVLDLVGGILHVDIEVKAAPAVSAVLVETGGRPELRFAISSFNHDVLRYARSNDPDVELWPLATGISDDVMDTARELGSPCIAAFDGMLGPEIINHVRSRNIDCWVWTVNDPERAAQLSALGVSGICTDDPASVIERLASD